MKKFFINIIVYLKIPILFIGIPFTYISAVWLKYIRKVGMDKISNRIFMHVGVLPVVDDYYQPLINPRKHLRKSLREDRVLQGIDFNVEEQLDLLKKFRYNEEIEKFSLNKRKENEFYFNNNMYSSGDADFLYNMIRYFTPGRLVEIGSGFSTLMARGAIAGNQAEDSGYVCEHICIEPYEREWLGKLDIKLIRKKVEEVGLDFFRELEANDILFIDSSHIIRPQGDVLLEYLEILPVLKPGVLVHVHDIFSPRDYPDRWVYEEHLFWNEQYLLEAFLTHNSEFRILGALNFLAHHYEKELAEKCPYFRMQIGYEENKREPRSFWMVKN